MSEELEPKEIIYISSRGTTKYGMYVKGVIEFLEENFPKYKIVKQEDLKLLFNIILKSGFMSLEESIEFDRIKEEQKLI